MIEAQVPELADGGYWYIVPCTTDARGNRKPATAPKEWCAIYGVVGGVDYALLRSPSLWLQAPPVPVTQEQVIAAAQVDGFHPTDLNTKPEMRVGGL